jgi:hypothetical protein
MLTLKQRLTTLAAVLARALLGLFLLLATLAVTLPLTPEMPGTGLDPSWQFAMNQAVAQHLVFGRDLVFTHGPYAAIATLVYHPATDALAMVGSLLIGSVYALQLLLLMRSGRLRLLFCFGLFLAGFMLSRDALLFSGPLLLIVLCCLSLLPAEHPQKLRLPVLATAGLPLLFLPLGLLPLIKGSLLLLALAMTLLGAVLFWQAQRRLSALLAILLPLATMVLFWTACGQPLAALPDFLWLMGPIITGYTNAMARDGAAWQVTFYLLTALAMVLALCWQKPAMGQVRRVLVPALLVYLFLCFKAGFVRQDDHAVIAAMALAFAAFFVMFFLRGCLFWGVALVAALGCWKLASGEPLHVLGAAYTRHVTASWTSARSGLARRLWQPQALAAEYAASLERIRQKLRLPTLPGSTDMYGDQQAYLLASGNRWAPRPVLQSYSAYTPALAELNVAHLRGRNAPDNLLFRIDPIDGRLPALEDGSNWPDIMGRYDFTGLDHDLAYLKRRPQASMPAWQTLGVVQAQLGRNVELPSMPGPVQIALTLHETLPGHLLSLFYHLPVLNIHLTMVTGEQRSFRLVPGMAESGFIITPLVEDTQGFIYLASGNPAFLAGSRVRSFSITASQGQRRWWQQQYQVRLDALTLSAAGNSPFTSQDRLLDVAPAPWSGGISFCSLGNFILNGKQPSAAGFELSGRLSATAYVLPYAWRPAPQAVYFTLTDLAGKTAYIRALRPATNFGDEYAPVLPGFVIDTDISTLSGVYRLGMAELRRGELQSCSASGLLVKIVSTAELQAAAGLH